MKALATRRASAGFGLLALAALLLAACGGSSAGPGAEATSVGERIASELGLHGTALPGPMPRPDFVLTDTAGNPYDFQRETKGRVTLLYFGYTNCPDVCPVHFSNIAAAIKDLPIEEQLAVTVVFVGVDAPRDTPERVRQWLDFFDEKFIGLTGTPDELEAAQIAAGVPPAYVDQRFEGGYTVGHAAWVSVYTQDDQMHVRYPTGVRQSQWAHDLDVLIREGWPSE